MPQRRQTVKPPNAISTPSSSSSSSSRWLLWVVVPALIVIASVFLPEFLNTSDNSTSSSRNRKVDKGTGDRKPQKVDVDEASFFASRKECPKLNPLLGVYDVYFKLNT